MPHDHPKGSLNREGQPGSPLVSCIIIFLNEEKYLAESIQSVLAQTYDNWELLLVDDGSSDSSPAIAQGFAEQYAGRIRYLTHEGGANRGMSASRNLGLREARGILISLLDGDDIWVSDKLEQQVAIFARFPEIVMTCGATLYWHSWQIDAADADALVRVGDEPSDGRPTRTIEQNRVYPPMELLKLLYPLGHGTSPSTSALAFKREFALEVGGFDESFPGLFEDQVFLVKAYSAGSIYIASACDNYYRQHSESCCNVTASTGQTRALRRIFLRWLRGYLDEIGCRDRALRTRLLMREARNEYPRAARILTRVRRVLRTASHKPN